MEFDTSINPDPIPKELLEQVIMLQDILVARSTGCENRNISNYPTLRENLLKSYISSRVPDFVKRYRDLEMYWQFIKYKFPSYAERRAFLRESFESLVAELENLNNRQVENITPVSLTGASALNEFWARANNRVNDDPEGAITLARTIVESTCKFILDELGIVYSEKDDLPKLYSTCSKGLNLAPSNHSLEPIKQILGGATTLVNGIGTLRNKLSDAHGQSPRMQVKPSPRHAKLAVNTAGAISEFLLETHLNRIQ